MSVRHRIVRRGSSLDRLLAAAGTEHARALLRRRRELLGSAAERELTRRAEKAVRAGDREAAAVYRFHRDLLRCCRQTGIERTFARLRMAGRVVPRLTERGSGALRRFRATGSPAELHAAVAAFDRAAALTFDGHPDRPAVLSNLGLALVDRPDPDRAVAVLEEAAGTSIEPAQRSAALANLGIALLAGPAHRAVGVLTEAVALAGDDEAERSRRLGNLGVALSARYRHAGDPDDLGRAAEAYEQALAGAGAPDRQAQLANLSTGLAERYAVHGRPSDLDRAIDLSEQALRATPAGAADRADRIENRALMLRDRFVRDGDLTDLDEAVAQLTGAVELTAGPGRADRLDQLATTLRLRAWLRDDPGELRRAVDLHREAAGSAERAGRARVLNNLGGTLRAWAAATDQPAALDEAISAYREALESAGSAEDRCAVRGNLGIGLLDRFDRTGAVADLDAAIDHLAGSVEGTGARSPDLAGRLTNLGNGLRRRFDRECRPDDADRATAAYRRAGNLAGSAEAALRAGLNWGRWASRQGDWARAREAFDAARTAADRLLAQQVTRRDKESWLAAFPEMGTRAADACRRLDDAEAAVLWLEWARARVLSDALDRDRSDLSGLRRRRPELADRYRAAAARVRAMEVPAGRPG